MLSKIVGPPNKTTGKTRPKSHDELKLWKSLGIRLWLDAQPRLRQLMGAGKRFKEMYHPAFDHLYDGFMAEVFPVSGGIIQLATYHKSAGPPAKRSRTDSPASTASTSPSKAISAQAAATQHSPAGVAGVTNASSPPGAQLPIGAAMPPSAPTPDDSLTSPTSPKRKKQTPS